MPLHSIQIIHPSLEVGIWKITEAIPFFLDQLVLKDEELEEINGISEKRQLEWLAGRWLLHVMSKAPERIPCLKDDYGKPYLANLQGHISISHSRDMIAIAISSQAVGVDIEYISSKIEKIEKRFMTTEEIESVTMEHKLAHLHTFWGAKEALYKAWGKRALDFRKNIFVEPFTFDLKVGKALGWVKKDDYTATYQIFYQQIDNFILVISEEV